VAGRGHGINVVRYRERSKLVGKFSPLRVTYGRRSRVAVVVTLAAVYVSQTRDEGVATTLMTVSEPKLLGSY